MSLINQMFKELEKRRVNLNQEKKISPPLFVNTQSRLRRYKWMLFVLVVIAAGFFLIDFFVVFDHITDQEIEKNNKISPASLPSVASANSPNSASSAGSDDSINHHLVQLKGVTIEILGVQNKLRFLLSASTLYRISSEPNGVNYSIVFDGTKSSVDLPLIDYKKTGIRTLKMTNKPDGSLLVQLSLKQGAHVAQAGIFPGKAEFIVDLTYTPPIEQPTASDELPLAAVRSEPQQKASFAEQSLNAALQLRTLGETDKAISLLKTVLDIDPAWHPAREALAQMLMQQGQTALAESVLQIGLNQYPQWLPYVELQARCLSTQGQVGEAINLMTRYNPSLNHNPNYYALLATLYQKKNQPQMAAHLYQQLISSRPDIGKWWLGYAVSLDAFSHHEEAVTAYTQALAVEGDPLSPTLKAWVETKLNSSS